ncbi:fam-a protein [Plasmodium chabaudi adami]|uniref:Fam-a protein n=1 Tax=Plasmodium chabaudi adami TaxID=5826 RepID=A0A1C6WLK2_PLACE|nr:fam-a protein [Plasmodium chabaudi adami]
MNKFYIQFVLFLLSIFIYSNNKTLADEAYLVNDTINNPVQTKTNPANKPAQKNTTPQNEPNKAVNNPSSTPVQVKDTASNNPAQANKKVKKSGVFKVDRKFSSIFLSIFRAFSCGTSKPKKDGQNVHVRAIDTPENTDTENTTTENTITENTATENTTTENTATEIATPENITIDDDTFDELYENNNHLLCNNPEEIEKVTKLMSESAAILQKQIESTDDFRNYLNHEGARLFRKQDETDTGKMEITIENPDAYDGIKTTLWNPNSPQNTDPRFLMGQVVRVYNPNLMMIQQCYTSGGHSSVKYFHYFAHKIEVSKDKTIMVYFSTNKSDINDSVERNMGILIDIAYSLKRDCNYEEEFKNNYVNLSGYFINKDDTKIDITYLDSIYNDYILAPLSGFKRVRSKKYTQLMNLKGKFSKKNRYIPNSTFLLD